MRRRYDKQWTPALIVRHWQRRQERRAGRRLRALRAAAQLGLFAVVATAGLALFTLSVTGFSSPWLP